MWIKLNLALLVPPAFLRPSGKERGGSPAPGGGGGTKVYHFSLLWAGFWAHWQWEGHEEGSPGSGVLPWVAESPTPPSRSQQVQELWCALRVGSGSPRKGSLFFWDGLGCSSRAGRYRATKAQATLTAPLLLPPLRLPLADQFPGWSTVILKPWCTEESPGKPDKKADSQAPPQTHWIKTSGDGTWVRVVFLGQAGSQDTELPVLKLRIFWANWDKLVTWQPTGPPSPLSSWVTLLDTQLDAPRYTQISDTLNVGVPLRSMLHSLFLP